MLQRYHGWYSSRRRGKRRKAAESGDDYEEHPLVTVELEHEAKTRRANLLRRNFEVDQLARPR